jgi:hypothetical protein
MTAMLPMKRVRFCTHDAKETSVYYCKSVGEWLLTNKIGLCLSYGNLQRALGDMYCITGINHNEWTILEETE